MRKAELCRSSQMLFERTISEAHLHFWPLLFLHLNMIPRPPLSVTSSNRSAYKLHGKQSIISRSNSNLKTFTHSIRWWSPKVTFNEQSSRLNRNWIGNPVWFLISAQVSSYDRAHYIICITNTVVGHEIQREIIALLLYTIRVVSPTSEMTHPWCILMRFPRFK